ncbi:MAG: hypothetical protein Q4G16_04595 [Cruoricaptor ignavus]|nr:hypothetical protein [Cruoricaptor ignavus]
MKIDGFVEFSVSYFWALYISCVNLRDESDAVSLAIIIFGRAECIVVVYLQKIYFETEQSCYKVFRNKFDQRFVVVYLLVSDFGARKICFFWYDNCFFAMFICFVLSHNQEFK